MTEKKTLKEEELNEVAGGERLLVTGYHCNICDFNSEDEETMKKHLHDDHGIGYPTCFIQYEPCFVEVE